MAHTPGAFIWYELLTSDVAAAQRFYPLVLGWSVRSAEMPGIDYRIFSANGADLAGLMAVPEPAASAGVTPNWIGHILARDVDASAKQIERLGGRVIRAPEDIPNVGRFAIGADPQGAVFSIFRGNSSEGPPDADANAIGRAGWRELHTTDSTSAFAFYADLFGWTKAEAIDMGPMGVYQIFAHDGAMIGGMMNSPAASPKPFWLFYFNVEAIDAARDRVLSGGGTITNGPNEVPGGSWIVQCRDPQGASFGLVAPRR